MVFWHSGMHAQSIEAEIGPQAGISGQAAADDWELDPADIAFQEKIASGAFGDLYKGSYCGQDVAIKILRNVHTDTQQYGEFLQVRPGAVGRRSCGGPPAEWGAPG